MYIAVCKYIIIRRHLSPILLILHPLDNNMLKSVEPTGCTLAANVEMDQPGCWTLPDDFGRGEAWVQTP